MRWRNGEYTVGIIVKINGTDYVKIGQYTVPLDAVINAINSGSVAEDWRVSPNNIWNWFRANHQPSVNDAADPQKFLNTLGDGPLRCDGDRRYNTPGYNHNLTVAQGQIQTLTEVGMAATPFGLPLAGFVEVNGFRFSAYYYNKLWSSGRKAPGLIAKEVLEGAKYVGVPDTIKPVFYRYVFGG
jgi:hypothetical protein